MPSTTKIESAATASMTSAGHWTFYDRRMALADVQAEVAHIVADSNAQSRAGGGPDIAGFLRQRGVEG
jgi:hypothetical protein